MSTVSAPPTLGARAAAQSAYILDDEAEIGTLVAAALVPCGFSSRKFTEVDPFFKELNAAFPGLIVLDLALGHSDAIEIIRRLQSLKYHGKILLISGRDQATLAKIAALGERHGMTMLKPLQKPFRASDIKARLMGEQPDARADTADLRLEPNRPEPNRLEPQRPKKILIQVTDALRRNWLELWYQPKIDLKTLAVCGAEGLVRARHPELGIVDPENLLPPSGDAAYVPLSKFVLERALADWTRFAGQGLSVKLAVNVPVSVVSSPEFMTFVRRTLPTDATFPGLVVLISQDDLIRDSRLTPEIATQLELYNVGISVKHFKPAFAAQSRLNDLRFAEIKIDRGFVSECSSNPSRRALCQAVVDLAHRFGASACADGLEAAADLRTLIELGVDEAQGFLFAEPMPADRLAQRLLAGSAHSAAQGS